MLPTGKYSLNHLRPRPGSTRPFENEIVLLE